MTGLDGHNAGRSQEARRHRSRRAAIRALLALEGQREDDLDPIAAVVLDAAIVRLAARTHTLLEGVAGWRP